MIRYSLLAVVSVALITGCSLEPQSTAPAKKKTGIIGKTTQDIGKFDPNAGLNVVDSKIKVTTPGLAALESYGPMVQKTATLAVQQRLAIYNATNGKYPNYEEFMSEIVKNQQSPLKLPVLPGKMKYYYDEDNHTLVVVDPDPPEGGD